jgi:periplasmic divalent cation tolerance protein
LKIVLTTIAAGSAETLASKLVEERVAACVNVVPRVVSVYRWKGRVERADEAMLVVKTSDARLARLVRRIEELHPYDVPEIVALDPSRVNAAYRAWVDAETHAKNS